VSESFPAFQLFGTVVLEKIFKRPHIFSDYLPFEVAPFEVDLTLYLNKLEFPLPKDNLNQV
jgi:hypothetical protein